MTGDQALALDAYKKTKAVATRRDRNHKFHLHPFSSWHQEGTTMLGEKFEAGSCFVCIGPGYSLNGAEWRHGHPDATQRRRYEGSTI